MCPPSNNKKSSTFNLVYPRSTLEYDTEVTRLVIFILFAGYIALRVAKSDCVPRSTDFLSNLPLKNVLVEKCVHLCSILYIILSIFFFFPSSSYLFLLLQLNPSLPLYSILFHSSFFLASFIIFHYCILSLCHSLFLSFLSFSVFPFPSIFVI